MTRTVLWVGVLLGAAAWAQERPEAPTDCDDAYGECKEDCSNKFGGTTKLKMRARLNPCIAKCQSVETDCRERFFETKRNNLDEGALKESPGSRAVDEDGLPITSAPKKKEKEEVSTRTRVSDPPPPKAEEPARAESKPPPPPYELKPEEVPKSNRTSISKVDPKSEKPKVAEVKEEPPPRREEPKKKESGLDSDVRGEDDAPAKKPESKKKDEKKSRAIDDWDPNAE